MKRYERRNNEKRKGKNSLNQSYSNIPKKRKKMNRPKKQVNNLDWRNSEKKLRRRKEKWKKSNINYNS